MKIVVEKINRGYTRKATFPGPGNVMWSVEVPANITISVSYDPEAEKGSEVAKKAGKIAGELAKAICMEQFLEEYGPGAANPVRIPEAVGVGKGVGL